MLSGRAIKDNEGNVTELIAVLTDITQRKEAEVALRNAYEKMKSIDQLRSDIISNVSHELKTPITIIGGSIELAMEEDAPEERNYLLSKSQEALRRQLKIVNNLVDLSTVETYKPLKKNHDLKKIIQRSTGELQEYAKMASVSLYLNIPDNLPIVPLDANKIDHVLGNLLENAIKFNKKGGRVDIIAVRKKNLVEVSISDSGIGIKKEDLDKVFEPLTQLDPSTRRFYGGTGTGLTVVKRIVESHGGKIWVESKFGEGSIFCFTLPLI